MTCPIVFAAYELWFKQILYEVDSVRNILNDQRVDESRMLLIITRLNRVNLIMKVSERLFLLSKLFWGFAFIIYIFLFKGKNIVDFKLDFKNIF